MCDKIITAHPFILSYRICADIKPNLLNPYAETHILDLCFEYGQKIDYLVRKEIEKDENDKM